MKLLVPSLAIAFVSIANAQQGPLMQAIMGRYSTVKQNLIESAEAMPEADYSFHLSPKQRSFGEWIDHTVVSVTHNCSTIAGVAAHPASKLATKAELVQALKDAFAICDAALPGFSDAKALSEVTVAGKKIYPVTPMIAMVTGLNEHYGNLVGYLRSKGLTPPSTARAMKK